MNMALGHGMYSPLPKHKAGAGHDQKPTAAELLPPLPPPAVPSRASKAIPGGVVLRPRALPSQQCHAMSCDAL